MNRKIARLKKNTVGENVYRGLVIRHFVLPGTGGFSKLHFNDSLDTANKSQTPTHTHIQLTQGLH